MMTRSNRCDTYRRPENLNFVDVFDPLNVL